MSTRARCWLDDAAGDHNILRSTRVQFPSVPRARQHTASRGHSGTRFLIARALGEYLGRSAPGTGLLTSLSTDSQAHSRAFAAEFLAPAAALRRRLPGNSVEPERADDLAREFGVSSELIRRQIQNHGLATVVEY